MIGPAALRLLVIFALFWLIGLSLGYPTLNRYQPGAPQLSDATYYAGIVETGIPAAREASHWGYRLMVPMLARPIYLSVNGKLGSWDARFFALLVVNAAFCAATALILFVLGRDIFADPRTGLIASLLFLANFNISNLYLSGLVDSAEVFLLAATLFALQKHAYVLLPLLGIAGGFARETFVVLSACLAGGWWLHHWRAKGVSFILAVYVAAMALAGFVVVLLIRVWISGEWMTPIDIARTSSASTQSAMELLRRLLSVPATPAVWYTFGWVLPLAAFGLRRVPAAFVWAMAASFVVALAMAVYGGAGDNIGRPLFSAIGPIVSLAAAAGLIRLLGAKAQEP